MTDQEYNLRKAQIVQKFAQAKYQRASELGHSGSLSEQEFEEASMELELANLEVERYTQTKGE